MHPIGPQVLFILIPILWLFSAFLVVVLCQAAARGDAALAAAEAPVPRYGRELPAEGAPSPTRTFKRPRAHRAGLAGARQRERARS